MIFQNRIAGILRRTIPAAVLLFGAAALPQAAKAVSFDIFLIADHTTPSSSSSAPLNVTTQGAYRLYNLNGKNKAGSIELVDDFSFGINAPLTFNSKFDDDPAKPTDPGEAGAGTAAYVNSQISSWDNSNISGTTIDDDEQVDFGRNASITFNSVAGGFTDLIISDLGGLNPFDLSLCPTALCDTATQLFGGLKTGVRNTLVNSGLFATSDTGIDSNQDQTWLFRFETAVTDFVRLLENDNRGIFTGARLQADFIGSNASSTTPSPVPGPAGLPLLASGLVLMGWTLRRKAG